jgi:crotonobetainyl-CoA:carnitine CoA-transferase CaiB-like acyl-CoA transferase
VGLMARDRTDGAVHVDVAAQEVGAALVGDQLIESQLRGCVDEPLGNHHPLHAPHNAYRCQPIDGEQAWLALAVETDEQWARLAEWIDDWRLDPHWDARARKVQESTIDATISEWTQQRERDELIEKLQRLGIAAAPSSTARDLWEDKHVRERGMWSGVDHQKMGHLEVLSLPWMVNGARIALDAAPTLGQDNDYVYRKLLGMNDAEQQELVAQGIAY